jgi:hypothetical protein
MGIFDDVVNSIIGVNAATKRIRKKEFEKALKGIPQLSGQERTYIKGVFGRDTKDGNISIPELKKELEALKSNQTDPLSDQDVQRLKGRLSGLMIDKLNQ